MSSSMRLSTVQRDCCFHLQDMEAACSLYMAVYWDMTPHSLVKGIYWPFRGTCCFHLWYGGSRFLWSIYKYLSDCTGSHWEDTYVLIYRCENLRVTHSPSVPTGLHYLVIQKCTIWAFTIAETSNSVCICFLTGSSVCTIPCDCYLSGFSNNSAYWQHPSDSSDWRYHGHWRNPH